MVEYSGEIMNKESEYNADPIIALYPREYRDYIESGNYVPVMSYYDKTKKAYIGQDILDHQIDRYNELVSNAKKIAIVGISYNVLDTHIWLPLLNTSAKVFYYEPFDTSDLELAFRGKSNLSIIRKTFDECFYEFEDEMGIEVLSIE